MAHFRHYIKSIRTKQEEIGVELTSILDRFRLHINNIIAANSYDEEVYNRPNFYSEAWFTDDGITMRKYGDRPGEYHDSRWAWEEVEDILSVPE
jgi:hypothetical protein